jgi:hypothetical protein
VLFAGKTLGDGLHIERLPPLPLATISRESRTVATQCTLIVVTGLVPPRGLHVEDIIVNRHGELRSLHFWRCKVTNPSSEIGPPLTKYRIEVDRGLLTAS